MATDKVIMWFRQDLRLSDNPALVAAAKAGNVLPVYILDDINAGEHQMGGASRWWLHQSLQILDQQLQDSLHYFHGCPIDILSKLIKAQGISAVYWNRCYEPWRIKRDKQIKKILQENGVAVHTFNGSLLWEPWETLKSDGTPYKVFTPFYRRGCLGTHSPRAPMQKPRKLSLLRYDLGISLDALKLIPQIPWYKTMSNVWQAGEQAAKQKLKLFLENGLWDYKEGRNFPAKQCVSQLSPYLHFGHMSPNQIWYALDAFEPNQNIDCFRSELGWREFSYSQLFHFPTLPKDNWQAKFNAFPWIKSKKLLRAWHRGKTGYPIVDAGMRELWQTGYMHNRVRMIVGSFLVKNCLIHWREGEAWFWDCLVDADLASNSASWQWVAGCGADAAPYFRIFNPVTQGEKFDVHGEYTKRFVPELRNMPDKYLYCPWDAPDDVLSNAGVYLGKNYPKPIVDLKASRADALAAYDAIKSSP